MSTSTRTLFSTFNNKPPDEWIAKELATSRFGDKRLDKRFERLVNHLWHGVGNSLPFACQDWANTKAAYRFLSNDKVTECDILASHFASTQARVKQTPILILHDTTEFTYKREPFDLIGVTNLIKGGAHKYSGRAVHTVCGLLMHSSLAVTTDGLPLGLAAVKFWTRRRFKGSKALSKKINPTRVPIDQKESFCWLENLRASTGLFARPEQCVHIGDRGSDIYELFCVAQTHGTHFLIRTCVDRLAGDGGHTVAREMQDTRVKGFHRVTLHDKNDQATHAKLEIKYRRITVLPPIGKQKCYPPLVLTVLHASEVDAPAHRKKLEWKLITDLPVRTRKEAIEKLDWYAMRWKIELFHKILKSGCKAEDSKLRTAQRLTNIIAIFCIVSWRIFWMTMLNRTCHNCPARAALTPNEIGLLQRMIKKKAVNDGQSPLSQCLVQIAKLGGYLARARDPPPGNTVMWRGLARLSDIQMGFNLKATQ